MTPFEYLTIIGGLLVYALRNEHRFTKLETQITNLPCVQNGCTAKESKDAKG